MALGGKRCIQKNLPVALASAQLQCVHLLPASTCSLISSLDDAGAAEKLLNDEEHGHGEHGGHGHEEHESLLPIVAAHVKGVIPFDNIALLEIPKDLTMISEAFFLAFVVCLLLNLAASSQNPKVKLSNNAKLNMLKVQITLQLSTLPYMPGCLH